MKEKIQELRNSGLTKLEKLVTTDQLSDWHRDFLGRKGELTLLLKQLGELPAEERPAAGKEVNRPVHFLPGCRTFLSRQFSQLFEKQSQFSFSS